MDANFIDVTRSDTNIMEINLSDNEVRSIAEAIVPTVYDVKCPLCLAVPTGRCRDVGSEQESGDRSEPHMERIRKAVAIFMRQYLLKQAVNE